jgi:hypothetical protein
MDGIRDTFLSLNSFTFVIDRHTNFIRISNRDPDLELGDMDRVMVYPEQEGCLSLDHTFNVGAIKLAETELRWHCQ